ncbi:MAG: hypothetical protein K6E59_03525 [Bacilli bacterium]|nr:hypothetical protein [Bacilli bacterium]
MRINDLPKPSPKVPYIPLPSLEGQIQEALQDQKRPILFYCPKPIGKSTVAREMVSRLKEDKIIIEFTPSSASAPLGFLYDQIHDGLEALGYELPLPEGLSAPTSFETKAQRNLGILNQQLEALQLSRPLTILINDINLPFDQDYSRTFLYNFLFHFRKMPANLRVLMTTNSKMQAERYPFFEVINLKERDNPKAFFESYLSHFGRDVDQEALLQANPGLGVIDYKWIAEHLIHFVSPMAYLPTFRQMLGLRQTYDILYYTLNHIMHSLPGKAQALFAQALLDLLAFPLGLSPEQIVYADRAMLKKESAYLEDYCPLDEETETRLLNALLFFASVDNGRLCLTDTTVRAFVVSVQKALLTVLEDAYPSRLEDAVNHLYLKVETVETHGMKLGKERYLEVRKEDDKDANPEFFLWRDLLCLRLSWVISSFSKEVENNAYFSSEDMQPGDALKIAFIDHATAFFAQSHKHGFLDDMLCDKWLMYFVGSKSHRLANAILQGLIDSWKWLLTKTYGQASPSSIATSLSLPLSHLTQKESHGGIEDIRIELLLFLSRTMRKERVMENGAYKEFIDDMLGEKEIGPMDSFFLTCCNSKVVQQLSLLERDLNHGPLEEDLRKRLVSFATAYSKFADPFDKIGCAYLGLRTYAYMNEKGYITDKEKASMPPFVDELFIVMAQCFFPEAHERFGELLQTIG